MDAERDLSKFLYHLSREIVTSRDYSDCNINRICNKYYEHSSYPDKERLRKLVADLKRKLQIYQQETDSDSLVSHHDTLSIQQRSCPHANKGQQTSFPAEEEDEFFAEKCVGTQSIPFFPRTMITDATQYQPQSTHSIPFTQPCRSFHSTVPSCESRNRHFHQQKRSSETPRSSQESETLIEQILLKHSGIGDDTSSEILMRMAASDRVLYDSCKGQCPLHGHGNFGSKAGPSSARGDGGECSTRALGKTTCNCPLKQCKHFETKNATACGAGGAGCSGCASDAPILKQAVERGSQRVGCCGKKRKKKPSGTRNGSSCKGRK